MNPQRLKLYVLSNLLDCAVQSPNMHKRRKYIERIMKLDKPVQKVLMGLIEKRGKKQKTPSPVVKKSPLPSRESLQQKRSLFESPNKTAVSTPKSSNTRSPLKPKTLLTPAKTPNSDRNVSFGTPIAVFSDAKRETPAPKSGVTRSDVESVLLSPGTLESPNRVQTIVHNLHVQTKQTEGNLQATQQRETELQTQLDQLQASHRQEMMRLESTQMDREQEMMTQYHANLESLQQQLAAAQAHNAQSAASHQELLQARDELEVLRKSRDEVSQVSEKYRRATARLEQFQDVAQSLEREQAAHGQAIEEIVRLESENKHLLDKSRQLVDYQERSAASQVQAAAALDQVAKLQAQLQDAQTELAQLHREREVGVQVVPIVHDDNGPSIAAGVSELNPQIASELARLRQENGELRSFCAARTDDAVSQLTTQLSDAQRLGERFKHEYLNTQSLLETTQGKLKVSQDKCQELQTQVSDLETQVTTLEDRLQECQTTVDQRTQECNETRIQWTQALAQVQESQTKLEILQCTKAQVDTQCQTQITTIADLQKQVATKEQACIELQTQMQTVQAQLVEGRTEVSRLTQIRTELEHTMEQSQASHQQTVTELQQAEQQIKDLQGRVGELTQIKVELSTQMEQERASNQDAVEEAHKSLEATREVLQAKAQKELDQLEAHFTQLLEDERKLSQHREEDYVARQEALEERWSNDYQDLQQQSNRALQETRDEMHRKMTALQTDCQAKVDSARRQAEQAREKLVHKGRNMIEDAKDKAKQEMGQLYDKKTELEAKVERLEAESAEVESLLRGKIKTLKNKLEVAAARVGELTNYNEDLDDKIVQLERERESLQQDNDRQRRQLRGQYGSGDKVQNQLEQLQREYNTLLEEHRQLRQSSSRLRGLDSIAEEEGYERGSRGMIQEMKLEFESVVDSLQDEKRELVMKHSAAMTDVKKAEQRAWEAEQTINKLQDQVTSLKLRIERLQGGLGDLSDDDDDVRDRSLEHQSPTAHMAYFSASSHADEAAASPKAFSRTTYSTRSSSRSPHIDRAMREKVKHEKHVRNKIETLKDMDQLGLNRSREQLYSPPPSSSSKTSALSPFLLNDEPLAQTMARHSPSTEDDRPECQQS